MVAATAALFLYGTIASMLGTLLPDLSTHFHLTPRQNGGIAAVQALGLVLASIAAGPLIDGRGKKIGFIMGMMLIVVALFALPVSVGWKTVMVAMFVLGLGGGILVTAANNLVSDIGESKRASMLSFANMFFGLGALLTPMAAANLFHGNAVGLCYLVAALAVGVLLLEVSTPMPAAAPPHDFGLRRLLNLDGRPLLSLLSLFIFLYIASEVAFWNWLTKYLVSQGISRPVALNILAFGFAAGLLLGRLLSIRLLLRYSSVLISFVCPWFMVATIYWVLHSGSALMAGISVFCAGLVMGPIYPSAMGMVGDAFRQMTATYMGIVITWGWVGVVTSSWLIGMIAGNQDDRLGQALLLLPVFSATMILTNLALRPLLARARARNQMVYDAPAQHLT
jgi:fucose permease